VAETKYEIEDEHIFRMADYSVFGIDCSGLRRWIGKFRPGFRHNAGEWVFCWSWCQYDLKYAGRH
jgi:hypothetical protein